MTKIGGCTETEWARKCRRDGERDFKSECERVSNAET